uniref:Photosystem I reaction center subunit IX n=1 Tax=Kryptoperidinium triquetrum TaxID=66468 RepID=A8I1T1_KRYTR|nr:unknown [Heterocapsa triquetra]
MARNGAPIFVALVLAGAWLLSGPVFVNSPATQREVGVAVQSQKVKSFKKLPVYGERDPLPKGYAIRTGLSDLLKPLNSEYGVTAKEDSIGTYAVMISAIVLLFLFYLLLLLINNQSVLLPPEDEFDEYVANFLPYFFFGEK